MATQQPTIAGNVPHNAVCLSARVEELEETFAHIHKRREGDDICAICGLDLRDKIHQERVGK